MSRRNATCHLAQAAEVIKSNSLPFSLAIEAECQPRDLLPKLELE